MSIFDSKLIHVRRLYRAEDVSLEKGRRVMSDLKGRGLVDPCVIPSGREFVSANEAQVFHEALRG